VIILALERFLTDFSNRSLGIGAPDAIMYLEGPTLQADRIEIGDKVPTEVINNLADGIAWDDVGWYETIWGFADAETGKKLGSMAMAMEDHRGFQGDKVFSGYNPWGWGSVNELRGLGFNPNSIIAPEQMERIAAKEIPGIRVSDPEGDIMLRLDSYLPFNESVNKFNVLVPLIEDEESSIDEYIRALVENGIGENNADNMQYTYQINRFTQAEMDDLIVMLNRSLTPDQINYLGIGDMEPGDMQLPMMFNNIINSMPEADFALIKNELSGNSRFRLPVEAWQDTFEAWMKNDAKSNWFDREYLDNLAGDDGFLKKMYADPSAIHEDGTRYVIYDPESYFKWDFEMQGIDSSSFLDMVFDTITGKEQYPEYESLRAALMKEGQTPAQWNPAALQKNSLNKQLTRVGRSNLDNLQPTFRNDRFGLTNKNKRYDSRAKRKKNNPGIRYRNYDQGKGVVRRYVANPLKKFPNREAAGYRADYLRRNGLWVRSVKMSDGTYLNYTSPKSQKPTYTGKYRPLFSVTAMRKNN
jgi:hypothetical protein